MSRLWILLLPGCTAFGIVQPPGRPVTEAYHGSAQDRLKVSDATSPFSARQPVPVLTPPEVFAVYVPSRIDRRRDLLIGEHWIFLKLRDAEWFTERGAESEPPALGTAGDAELAPVRGLDFEPILVPWRGSR